MAEVPIKRGFVSTSRGQVHYRVAGQGRPLILLHPSPFSSRRFLPLLPAMGRRRRVYAIDTPGYGESYRPTSPPSMADYADVVAEVITGLGYDSAPLYGDLSGSIVALTTAARRPDRISALSLGVISYFGQNPGAADAWRKRVYPVAFQLAPPAADGGHFHALYRKMVDAGLHKSFPEQVISPAQVTEWVLERMTMRDAALWGFEATFQTVLEDEIPKLRCPILLAQTEAHGNEEQIAQAKAILPPFELQQGPKSFLIEDVCDFLADVIPNFLENHGV